MKQRRSTPRRRDAPRWTSLEWTSATQTLMWRSGGRCECCGGQLNGRAERHHRKRREAGGDRLSNILLLLPEHHTQVTLNPTWSKARGLIVPPYPHFDPETEPVLYMGKRWVTIDDQGNKHPHAGPPPIG